MITKRRVKMELPHHIHEFPIGRKVLVPGTEVAIKGRRGCRWRFQYARKTSAGLDELTFVGGPLNGQHEQYLSVYPERVTRVFKTGKTLTNIQKEKKNEHTASNH